MAKHSEFSWSEALSYTNPLSSSPGTRGGALGSSENHNPISRFSLNSSLTLHSVIDFDATCSSNSSCSATNNSSNSLSVSPAIERDASSLTRPTFKQQHQHQNSPKTATVSKHLLELQREIKEEEEEIFADINSLINGRSSLYPDFIETNGCEISRNADSILDGSQKLKDDPEGHPIFNNNTVLNDATTTTIFEPATSHNQCSYYATTRPSIAPELPAKPYYVNNNNFSGGYHKTPDTTTTSDFLDSEDSLDFVVKKRTQTPRQPSEFIPASAKTIRDSDDRNIYILGKQGRAHHRSAQILEDESGEDEENQYDDNQDPRGDQSSNALLVEEQDQFSTDGQDFNRDLQSVIQQVTSNLPKPCVFFLEGNCRRSDCKYSHDLSNITCKYWVEGFCFKGEMCPFSHSFMPQNDHQFSLDDDILESLRKKRLDPTFVIESEADFPSLPLDSPTTKSGNRQKSKLDPNSLTTSIKNQILSSNPAVVFKTVKKKRKKG